MNKLVSKMIINLYGEQSGNVAEYVDEVEKPAIISAALHCKKKNNA